MIEFGIVRFRRSLMAALAAIVNANPSNPISARRSKTATSAEAADPLAKIPQRVMLLQTVTQV